MLENLVVCPLLFLLNCVDDIVDQFEHPRRRAYFKGMPPRNGAHCFQVDPGNPRSPYRSVVCGPDKQLVRLDDDSTTKTNLYETFRESSKRLADVRTLGVRETVGYEDETQESGKVFKKNIMRDEYVWLTYSEVIDKIDHASNGLLKLGLKSNQNIVVFSETRPEWLMSAFACFKIKAPVVTLYSTLGICTVFS
jgi:long-chain acyl-CoA synthetase